jgi:hypoxanthine phosphoribosyltransferase
MSEFTTAYTAEQIHERVVAIAARIAEDYKDCKLVFVGILKGAAFLLTDLARLYPGAVDWEFVDVTTASGDRGEVVSLTYATHFNVRDRHVLIIKDVLHTGVTENYLMTHLSQQHPASMEIVAMVDKPQLRAVNLTARYSVFTEVPDGYLVGYGLGQDWDQYTNRPDLCVVQE